MSLDLVRALETAQKRAKNRQSGEGCSFCGKTVREVKGLVESNFGTRICNECVGLCVGLLEKAGNL